MSNREFSDPEFVLNTVADVRAILAATGLELRLWRSKSRTWRASVYLPDREGSAYPSPLAEAESGDLVQAIRSAVAKAENRL